jgi:hypothetical protein
VTANLALALSFLSFCVSALTFYRGSEWAQSQRAKREKMRVVATRGVIVWEQMHIAINAKRSGGALDPYFFPSYQRNVRRLEDAIEGAVSLGLFKDLVGHARRSVALHAAYIQSLSTMETIDPEGADIDDWIKEHFTMGTIRLLDCCIRHHPYSLPADLRERLRREISRNRDQAYTYIDQSSCQGGSGLLS